MFTCLVILAPAFAAWALFARISHRPLASLEALVLVPVFALLINLVDAAFLVGLGQSRLELDGGGLAVSFLLKYGCLSLAAAVFLAGVLRLAELLLPVRAGSGNGEGDPGTGKKA